MFGGLQHITIPVPDGAYITWPHITTDTVITLSFYYIHCGAHMNDHTYAAQLTREAFTKMEDIF